MSRPGSRPWSIGGASGKGWTASRRSIAISLGVGLLLAAPRQRRNRSPGGATGCGDGSSCVVIRTSATASEVAARAFTLLEDESVNVLDDVRKTVRDPELDEALRALLEAPHHAIKVILTTRIPPSPLMQVQTPRQTHLLLDAVPHWGARPMEETRCSARPKTRSIAIRAYSKSITGFPTGTTSRFHTSPRGRLKILPSRSRDRPFQVSENSTSSHITMFRCKIPIPSARIS